VAQQALVLAQVLFDGGGITNAEYQVAATPLAAAGASTAALPQNPLPQTTTTSPPGQGPGGHGHDNGGSGGDGGQ
jgi:hypothetical protein